MRRLPDFEAWAIFAKVADLGSYARAADALGLSKPTVSKAIARLEGRLGFSLLNRTSRRLSLTDGGRASLERARRILSEAEAAEDEALAQSTEPRGRVRVSAPLSFGIAYLGAALPDFMAAYPEITLDLALSDRQVDVVAEGFDLAIRIASLEDSSLLARRLCTVRILLVGAPGYFQRHGRPTHPEELRHHTAMAYSGGSVNRAWRFSHVGFGEAVVEPNVQVWTDNADIADAGVGGRAGAGAAAGVPGVAADSGGLAGGGDAGLDAPGVGAASGDASEHAAAVAGSGAGGPFGEVADAAALGWRGLRVAAISRNRAAARAPVSCYIVVMDRQDIITRLRANEATLKARGVTHAAVFGSRARGDARPDSDTDIMIEIDPAARIGVYEYVGLKDYIAGLFDGPVDVVNREGLKPYVRPAALTDAIYAF